MDDVNLNVDELEDELGRQTQIQADTIQELSALINQNGLFVGNRWRLFADPGDNNFYISDDFGGGYYRMTSLDRTLDVETVV